MELYNYVAKNLDGEIMKGKQELETIVITLPSLFNANINPFSDSIILFFMGI